MGEHSEKKVLPTAPLVKLQHIPPSLDHQRGRMMGVDLLTLKVFHVHHVHPQLIVVLGLACLQA